MPPALGGGFLTTGPPGKSSDNLNLWFPIISCSLECQLTLQWILQFQTSPRIINPLGNWFTSVSLLVSNGRRGLIEELKRGHVEGLSSTSTETMILLQTNKQQGKPGSERRDDSCVASPQTHRPLTSLSCLSFRRARKAVNTCSNVKERARPDRLPSLFFLFF